ncbi:MAG: glycosyltransferase family 4 protein, partial [Chloroflexi bacterium]|nr:glycosyltransferase family 4 protein [Chloroflexota bacterium]
SYAPILGGTETAVRELSLALRKRGHTVDILTTNMDAKWQPRWTTVVNDEDGGHVFRWGACNPAGWVRTEQLNRLIGRNFDSFVVGRLQHFAMVHLLLRGGTPRLARGYDVVHCHDEVDLTFAVALKPDVMHLHTLAEAAPVYERSSIARGILRRSARAWIANSRDSARRAITLGVHADSLTVVANGVDPDVFRPGLIPTSGNEVLFVGRIVPRKGLDVLLRALTHVQAPVNLRVVGTPSSERYAAVLRAAAADVERTSAHRIHFLGSRTGRQLVELYQQASVFVCPSLIEPFGIVALEAMSCEVAVLASRVDGLIEFVDNCATGLLCEPGDERGLAAQLERLLQDPALRRRLGRGGRERVISSFAWSGIAAQVERVYERALPRRR